MAKPHIDVKYVAALARLELSDDEVTLFSGQLDAILGHIEQLSSLDVSGIEPTSYPSPVAAPMRNDVPGTSIPVESVMMNAPAQAQSQIRVPKVVADA